MGGTSIFEECPEQRAMREEGGRDSIEDIDGHEDL
jgi:hypothetical protein